MNYSKIINKPTFAAILIIGASAGFVIGLKLPAVFASLYSPSSASIAATLSAVEEIVEGITPETEITQEIKLEVQKPTVSENVSEKTVGQKTETLQLINSHELVKDIGKPDLSVKVLETGVIDKITNVFTATTSLRSVDRIAVQPLVENLGTKETSPWYFNAVLPTFPSYIYSANSQVSLLTGDRIEFTLGFDSVEKKDGNVIVINIDPANSIFEASEDNNIARITIDGVSF